MNIPEGFVLVPVEPTGNQLFVGLKSNGIYQTYCDMVSAAPTAELTAYDEAVELAVCRAHWEKNPICLFSDMWLGWKGCAQSRDGSVSDE